MTVSLTRMVNQSAIGRFTLPSILATRQGTQHCEAWLEPRPGREQAIKQLIVGYALLADSHRTEPDDAPIGRCGFFGEHARDMIRALLAMLTTDTGRYDCGTLDRLIRKMAEASGVELEP